MITTNYDPEADAMVVRPGENITSERTEEVDSGVFLDFDAAGHVVGIEVLNVRSRTTGLATAA